MYGDVDWHWRWLVSVALLVLDSSLRSGWQTVCVCCCVKRCQQGCPSCVPLLRATMKRVFYLWRRVMSERIVAHVPSEYQRLAILNAVDYEARRAGLEPALVLGVIYVESRFNPSASNPVGARGLMQVMPFWAKTIGDGNAKNLYHMRINVRFGCVILRHYLDRENGDVVRALARCNGSLGQTDYAYSVLRASFKYR